MPIEHKRKKDNTTDRDSWLKTFIMNKIESAMGDESGDVSEVRQHNFDRYYGKSYGDERDGKSKFITREVFEAVEWAMPSLIRVFTSNTRACEFLPETEEDEQQAQQETDIVDYYIQTKNNGFLLLHNWFKDLLMAPNGYITAYIEEIEQVRNDNIRGVTLMDLNAIDQDPNMEILEAEHREQFVDGFGMQELYDIKVRRKETKRKLCIDNIPPDEMLIDSNHTSVDLEGCSFVCRRTRKSISDLVKMGYDYDELNSMGDVDDNTWNTERVNRLFYEDENPDADDEAQESGASRMLWVHDMTIEADYDDDGIAERRRILMIGDEIFENDEDFYEPFVSCAAIIIPHKHIAMSYIESMQDLQRLSTTVHRQLLDNTYAQTDKRHFFNTYGLMDDGSTIDDYLDARSDAIEVKGNPAEVVMPEVTTPITQELLAVIQHIKEQPKMRTGVAPELSLDPNTLQQSTMGAFMGALDQASQRTDMLVKVIAEVGMKRLMGKVHYLLRTHLNEAIQVKLRGGWTNFDPSTWHERSDMRVNVGLGHNSDQTKIQMLMALLQMQREALSQNLSSPEKIYNTVERLVDTAKIGTADAYFNNPSKPVKVTDPQTGQVTMQPWQPPQPQLDPQTILAQAQAQALQQEQQRKGMEAKDKHSSEMNKMQLDAQQEMERLEIERLKLKKEMREFEAKHEIDSGKAMADIRNINARTRETDTNIELKEAQTDKVYADINKLEEPEEGPQEVAQ